MANKSTQHGRSKLTSGLLVGGTAVLVFLVLWQVRDMSRFTGALIEPRMVGDEEFVIITGVSHGEELTLSAGVHNIITCPADEPPIGMEWKGPALLATPLGMKIYEYTEEYADEKADNWSGLHTGFLSFPSLTTFAAGKTYYAYADEEWKLSCSGDIESGSSSSSSSLPDQPPVIESLTKDRIAYVGQQFSINANATDPDEDPVKFIVARYDATLDIDGNNRVDIGDINAIGVLIGSSSGSGLYNARADLTNNGIINNDDITAFQLGLFSQQMAGFGFDANSGLLIGTPVLGQKGTYVLTFSAFTDASAYPKPYSTDTVNVTITDNQPPAFTSSLDITAEVGVPLAYTFTTVDPDTGTPAYFLSGNVPQADVDGDGDTDIGDRNIISQAIGQVLGDPGYFPPADLTNDQGINFGDLGAFAQLALDTYPDGNFSFNGVTGDLTWAPQVSDLGEHVFTASTFNTVSGSHPYSSATFKITVVPAGSSSSSSTSSSSDSSSTSSGGGGLSANLVGYWTFEEGAGSTVGDFSGNGNDASALGLLEWSTDVSSLIPFSTAAGLVNAGSYLEVPHPLNDANFPLNFDVDDPFTGSVWFKGPLSFTEATGIIGKLTSSTLNLKGWQLQATPDNKFSVLLSSSLFDSTLAITQSSFTPNSWHHLVFSYDGNTAVSGLSRLKLYVDGVQQTLLIAPGGGNNLGTTMAHTGPLTMAGDQSAANFPGGVIDDVRIYNVVTTPAEILE